MSNIMPRMLHRVIRKPLCTFQWTPDNARTGLNRYIVYAAFPALVVTQIHGLRLGPQLLMSILVPWLVFASGAALLWRATHRPSLDAWREPQSFARHDDRGHRRLTVVPNCTLPESDDSSGGIISRMIERLRAPSGARMRRMADRRRGPGRHTSDLPLYLALALAIIAALTSAPASRSALDEKLVQMLVIAGCADEIRQNVSELQRLGLP